jgi:predicted TPR repeat methyltransferase
MTSVNLHDSYAADYDNQVHASDCHIADVLFGMCYEFIRPHQCLLDLGIGSGLSAALFSKAGMEIYGMDFSRAMLEICRSKRIAAELKQQDLQQIPWQYPAFQFDHIICCGVLHFVSDLESIFDEATRVLRVGGMFAFSTKMPLSVSNSLRYEKRTVGDFEIFSHAPAYVQSLLDRQSFKRIKIQKCFVGEDIFNLWVAQKIYQRIFL